RRVDALDRTGHENFRPKALRLLQRAAGELIAGHTARESEVIFDARRRSRLPARSLAFDDQSTQTLRRAINRRGKSGGPAADHHRVVFGERRARLKAKQLRQPTRVWLLQLLSVRKPQHRAFAVRGARAGPFGLEI